MTRLIAACIVALGMAAATPLEAKVVKLATFAPVGSKYHDIILDMAEEWRSITGGEIEVRIYAGGVAGDESDLVHKMRIGQIDFATLTSGGLPGVDPRLRAFQVPMMFQSLEEFDYVVSAMRGTLDRIMQESGFRALAWADAGWLHFFSRDPVRVPDDLRPQRIFVWSGASRFVESWAEAGFRPIELNATDIHTALQSKMLDAVNAPPLIALSNQWFALAPNMTALNWTPMMGALVMSERAWDGIPKRHHAALLASAERTANRMRRELRAFTGEAMQVMVDYGLTIVTPSPDEIAIWRAEVRRYFNPLIGDYIDASLVAEIERLLDARRNTR